MMANYNLYNDGCMNVFPLLEDNSIQCIITDLPYDGVSKKGEELDATYFSSAKQRIESAYGGGDGSEVHGE